MSSTYGRSSKQLWISMMIVQLRSLGASDGRIEMSIFQRLGLWLRSNISTPIDVYIGLGLGIGNPNSTVYYR